MSRRRSTPSHKPDHIRFDMECDGTVTRPHTVSRIAKITVREWPDATDTDGGTVRVEYVRVDMDPDDNDYTMPLRSGAGEAHMTRRFVCAKCRADKPLRDLEIVRLGRRLDALGVRRVRFRELP